MKLRVKSSCSAMFSVAGSKGFLYPDDSRLCNVDEGTIVEFLSYVSGRHNDDLQAVAIENSVIKECASSNKIGVYWISRKNLEDAD